MLPGDLKQAAKLIRSFTFLKFHVVSPWTMSPSSQGACVGACVRGWTGAPLPVLGGWVVDGLGGWVDGYKMADKMDG